jgi:TolB-like protein/class 3 adenylate cyclase/Flp pilus assembly protein TadD
MDQVDGQHRDACILAGDVVGYSRLMAADEDRTYQRLTDLRSTHIDPCINAHDGRVAKNTGDGFLALFDSPAQAAASAIAIQRAVLADQERMIEGERIALRIGVHAANIIVTETDIFGDGVNIAARLQTYAPPGGVTLSETVMSGVNDLPGTIATDLGELYLHNMVRPVRMHCLRLADATMPMLGEVPPGDDSRPSIAVLPFRKKLANAEDAYFADGIVDDIIYGLAGLKELFVIARGSTLGFGGDEVDLRAIARELRVRYVLYGSVRRAGNYLRINTELTNTETGAILSAQKYDGELADLFDLQDRIALDVVTTIAPHVRERELMLALRKHPRNMTAYDLLLQAIDQLMRMDRKAFAHARSLLQRAMALDPRYATPYSYAAYWHVFNVGEGWATDPAADAREAARLAASALEINPNDSQALAISGHVQGFLLRDFDRAREYLDRAIAAGPSSALAWTMSSACCGYRGEGALAVKHGRQGLRLSPIDAHRFWHEGVLAQGHYVNGEYAEAVAVARRAAGHNGAVAFNLRTLATSLVALDRMDEARGAAQQLLRVQPGFRLGAYRPRCPFRSTVLDAWIDRLKRAGLPD